MRGMRPQQPLHARREEHVRRLLAIRLTDDRAFRHAGDFQERTRSLTGIARELHARRIRQPLTLATQQRPAAAARRTARRIPES